MIEGFPKKPKDNQGTDLEGFSRSCQGKIPEITFQI
jgi:hypothetical protein